MFTSPASIDRRKLKFADRRLQFQTPQRNLENLRVDVGEEVSVKKAEMRLQDQFLQMQMQMKMLVASLETSERARIAAEAKVEKRDASLKKLLQEKELEIKHVVVEESEEDFGAAGSGSQVDESDEESDAAESSSRVKARNRNVATKWSHSRIRKSEEHSVRKEDYQAALKDLEKIKKDGSIITSSDGASNLNVWRISLSGIRNYLSLVVLLGTV